VAVWALVGAPAETITRAPYRCTGREGGRRQGQAPPRSTVSVCGERNKPRAHTIPCKARSAFCPKDIGEKEEEETRGLEARGWSQRVNT